MLICLRRVWTQISGITSLEATNWANPACLEWSWIKFFFSFFSPLLFYVVGLPNEELTTVYQSTSLTSNSKSQDLGLHRNKKSQITVTLLLSIYLGYLDSRRHRNGRRTAYILLVVCILFGPFLVPFNSFTNFVVHAVAWLHYKTLGLGFIKLVCPLFNLTIQSKTVLLRLPFRSKWIFFRVFEL